MEADLLKRRDNSNNFCVTFQTLLGVSNGTCPSNRNVNGKYEATNLRVAYYQTKPSQKSLWNPWLPLMILDTDLMLKFWAGWPVFRLADHCIHLCASNASKVQLHPFPESDHLSKRKGAFPTYQIVVKRRERLPTTGKIFCAGFAACTSTSKGVNTCWTEWYRLHLMGWPNKCQTNSLHQKIETLGLSTLQQLHCPIWTLRNWLDDSPRCKEPGGKCPNLRRGQRQAETSLGNLSLGVHFCWQIWGNQGNLTAPHQDVQMSTKSWTLSTCPATVLVQTFFDTPR